MRSRSEQEKEILGADAAAVESARSASDSDAASHAAYRVELDREGCKHCGEGDEYRVVGPDDVGESTTFTDAEDAESFADALNDAFDKGRRSSELLAALKALVVAVRFNAVIHPQPDNPCWDARVPVDFVNDALNAIAKAEGRS